jgi:hypothetical protein
MKTKIKRNAAQCRTCGTVLESKYRHDFQTCICGKISVDGGKDYIRRCGNEADMIDLCEYEEEKIEGTAENWESGKLGRDERFVKQAEEE